MFSYLQIFPFVYSPSEHSRENKVLVPSRPGLSSSFQPHSHVPYLKLLHLSACLEQKRHLRNSSFSLLLSILLHFLLSFLSYSYAWYHHYSFYIFIFTFSIQRQSSNIKPEKEPFIPSHIKGIYNHLW